MKINNAQASESTKNQPRSWPFFRLAFRPFFLFGALFAAVNVFVWGLSFAGKFQFSPYGGGFFWHAHEMLFGFTSAIILGFLLTAVQTWTGVPSLKGKPLAGLFAIWLAARVLMAFPIGNSSVVILSIDLLFLPLAAVALSRPITKVKMWSNLFFVPVLLAMAALNAFMHFSIIKDIQISFITLSHVMIMLVTLIMCIMAGRVFPMFTANGTQTTKVLPIAWLEALCITLVLASIVVSTQAFAIPAWCQALIYFIAGLANWLRALRWRIWVTLGTPLVWSLHLSYWAICAGLLLLGLERAGTLNNASLAYHAITVGGIGLMVLAMISRVSLGHTGRIIKVGLTMSLAFCFVLVALLVRVFAPLLFDQYSLLVIVSASFWSIAYLAFVALYAPVLFSERVDGAN